MCMPTKPTIILEQTGNGYQIKYFDAMNREIPTEVIPVAQAVVEKELGMLKKVKVSLFPISPLICDGTLYDLKVLGENADLRVTWWTEPPNGCKALGRFAEWLAEMTSEFQTEK